MSTGPYRDGNGTPPVRLMPRWLTIAMRIATLPLIGLTIVGFGLAVLMSPFAALAGYVSGGSAEEAFIDTMDAADNLMRRVWRLIP